MKSSVHQTGKEEPVDLRPAIEMDALPLEYKLQNGAACGNLDFTNFVNDPVRAGVCGIFGLSLEKQALDFLRVELRAVPFGAICLPATKGLQCKKWSGGVTIPMSAG